MTEETRQFSPIWTILPRKLRTLSQLSWADRWLLLHVWLLLGIFRALILTVPFARLSQYFGQRLMESIPEITPEHLQQAKKIRWAIRLMSSYTPWESNCFPQALTAKYLLARRGITSTLYLGANFQAPGEMAAHAWLRCGPLFVTGGAGHLRFGTVMYFS